MPRPVRFRSRAQFEKAGLRGHRQDQGPDTSSLSRGIDGADGVRNSRSGSKAKRRAADLTARGSTRGGVGNRRPSERGSGELGGALGNAGRTFELDLVPSGIQPVGARLEMGKPDRQGSRRTLLAGVTLPIPPTINHYWRSAAIWSPDQGRHIVNVYKSADGKAYSQTLRDLMLERRAWYYSENLLHLRVLVCFDSDRKQEVDNRIKPLQDALAHAGVYKDDKQVKIVEARQGPKLKPACCIVWLDEFIPDVQANLRWIQTPVG